MAVEEAGVHAVRLGIVLQMTRAIVETNLIEGPAGHQAKVAVRVAGTPLVPRAQGGVDTKFPQSGWLSLLVLSHLLLRMDHSESPDGASCRGPCEGCKHTLRQ